MDARTMLEDIWKWHNSLGHPGTNMMNSLSKLGKILKFLKMDIASVVSHCDACNMAKARVGPILDKSTNKVTKMMERIHCDAVTGLPPTMGGKMGFSLIVNEHSKFIDVQLILRKNETQDHIKEFVNKMSMYGHRVTKLLWRIILATSGCQ